MTTEERKKTIPVSHFIIPTFVIVMVTIVYIAITTHIDEEWIIIIIIDSIFIPSSVYGVVRIKKEKVDNDLILLKKLAMVAVGLLPITLLITELGMKYQLGDLPLGIQLLNVGMVIAVVGIILWESSKNE